MAQRLKSTVSEKGQVTIPKPIRDRLVDELYGILRLGTDTDEFVESLRGETGDA